MPRCQMSKAGSTLRRLERQWARRKLGRVLPIKIMTYGPDDELYHEGDRTYTEEEMTALQADYQLIVVCYGDDHGPPGGREVHMTWGDE